MTCCFKKKMFSGKNKAFAYVDAKADADTDADAKTCK